MVYDDQTGEALAQRLGRDRVFVAPNALDQRPIQARGRGLRPMQTEVRLFFDGANWTGVT